MATVKPEYFKELQGKRFVLYSGLLDAAHRENLLSITTEVIQLPTKENGMLAVCKAKVNLDGKEFEGIGDASPDSVNRMIAQHIVRMAETRAKARALRDALNIGECSVEELADDVPATKTTENAGKSNGQSDDPAGGMFGGVAGDTGKTDQPKQNDEAKSLVLDFGKFNGKTLGEVLNIDRQYVGWLGENARTEAIRNAAKTLLRASA
jgi:hypothetical protein